MSAKTDADFLIEEQLRELGDKEPATEQIRVRFKYTDLSRETRMSPCCLGLGLADDRRGMSRSGDVSLSILITSMSGRKSLVSYAYHSFNVRKTPGLRLAFDAAERNGRFGPI